MGDYSLFEPRVCMSNQLSNLQDRRVQPAQGDQEEVQRRGGGSLQHEAHHHRSSDAYDLGLPSKGT